MNDKIRIYNTVDNILKNVTFEITVFLTIFLRSRSDGILSFNTQGARLSGGASHPLWGPRRPGEPSSHSHQAWGETCLFLSTQTVIFLTNK